MKRIRSIRWVLAWVGIGIGWGGEGWAWAEVESVRRAVSEPASSPLEAPAMGLLASQDKPSAEGAGEKNPPTGEKRGEHPSSQKESSRPQAEPPSGEKPSQEEKGPMPVPMPKEMLPKPSPSQPPQPKLPPLPPWRVPRAEEVRDRVFAWLQDRAVEPSVRAKIEELWAVDLASLQGMDLLVRTAMSFALAEPRTAELVKLCASPRIHLVPPSFEWLKDPKTDLFMAANLRLLYGRWLVHEMLYDEALEVLGDLMPDQVVDPATLLFYQSVAHYFLLHQQEGLRTLEALLREPERCPRRYVALASLMQEDLKGLREETLDHIARRMKDVERRLGLHRAGPKVRQIEDKIVEDLDKIIKRLEEQQQQQSSGSGSGGRTIRSTSPAQESRIIGGKGPGEVEKREIGSGSGWGNLPQKQREEVLQQIGRDFPAQYRDKIEQYFRKLADQSPETKKSP